VNSFAQVATLSLELEQRR